MWPQADIRTKSYSHTTGNILHCINWESKKGQKKSSNHQITAFRSEREI